MKNRPGSWSVSAVMKAAFRGDQQQSSRDEVGSAGKGTCFAAENQSPVNTGDWFVPLVLVPLCASAGIHLRIVFA